MACTLFLSVLITLLSIVCISTNSHSIIRQEVESLPLSKFNQDSLVVQEKIGLFIEYSVKNFRKTVLFKTKNLKEFGTSSIILKLVDNSNHPWQKFFVLKLDDSEQNAENLHLHFYRASNIYRTGNKQGKYALEWSDENDLTSEEQDQTTDVFLGKIVSAIVEMMTHKPSYTSSTSRIKRSLTDSLTENLGEGGGGESNNNNNNNNNGNHNNKERFSSVPVHEDIFKLLPFKVTKTFSNDKSAGNAFATSSVKDGHAIANARGVKAISRATANANGASSSKAVSVGQSKNKMAFASAAGGKVQSEAEMADAEIDIDDDMEDTPGNNSQALKNSVDKEFFVIDDVSRSRRSTAELGNVQDCESYKLILKYYDDFEKQFLEIRLDETKYQLGMYSNKYFQKNSRKCFSIIPPKLTKMLDSLKLSCELMAYIQSLFANEPFSELPNGSFQISENFSLAKERKLNYEESNNLTTIVLISAFTKSLPEHDNPYEMSKTKFIFSFISQIHLLRRKIPNHSIKIFNNLSTHFMKYLNRVLEKLRNQIKYFTQMETSMDKLHPILYELKVVLSLLSFMQKGFFHKLSEEIDFKQQNNFILMHFKKYLLSKSPLIDCNY